MREVDRPASLFGPAQLVAVTFPSADADVAVRHRLSPARRREVLYLVVSQNGPGHIYTGRAPEPGAHYLRSSVAGLTATVLLFLSHDAQTS
jgi:hypothetical protein